MWGERNIPKGKLVSLTSTFRSLFYVRDYLIQNKFVKYSVFLVVVTSQWVFVARPIVTGYIQF